MMKQQKTSMCFCVRNRHYGYTHDKVTQIYQNVSSTFYYATVVILVFVKKASLN